MTLLESKVKFIQDHINENDAPPSSMNNAEEVVKSPPSVPLAETKVKDTYQEVDILPEQTFGTNIVISPKRQEYQFEQTPVSPVEEPSAPFQSEDIVTSQDNVVVLEEAIKHSQGQVVDEQVDNDSDIHSFIERMKNRVETT
eukprot:CAMPEP_0117422636 /NCGR_PEP_ID=MMETSP0758-20121206/3444_1 /TAXON_ID=63605 /ORGANISM="Percolomonas cosmopolitus, Strain AE-1 (ATCC 50343)" /LENGTH=141 /DNA_ID=CAMNT_0005205391 /DNA_START=730 /DNA_END=1152 /DNA_ORIENTATION=+